MVIARSVNETFPYTIQAERDLPADQQTTFRLRRLPATIVMQLDQLHDASEGHVTLRIGDQRIVTLMAGLAGWENLNDAKGSPVDFKVMGGLHTIYGIQMRNPAQKDMVDLLPEEVAEELCGAIRLGNTITADDAKN